MTFVVIKSSTVAFDADTVMALEGVAANSTMSVVTVVAHCINMGMRSAWTNWLHHAAYNNNLWLHSISHLRSCDCHSHWLSVSRLSVDLLLRISLRGHAVGLLLLWIGLSVLRLHRLLSISHLLLWVAHWLLWIINWLLRISAHLRRRLLRIPTHLRRLCISHWLLHLNLNLRLLHHLKNEEYQNLHEQLLVTCLVLLVTTRKLNALCLLSCPYTIVRTTR